MDHRVEVGEGDQRLATVALDGAGREARPMGAAFRLLNLRRREGAEGRELASGTAELDAATAELGDKAGQGTADPQRLALTTPAEGFHPGRRYLVQDGVRRESFVLEAVDADSLRTKTPLTLRYGVGAKVLGLEVACTFPEDLATVEVLADEPILAVDWDFEGDIRDSRELIELARRTRARLGTVAGVYNIDGGVATFIGERRKVADALEQANREILAELTIHKAGHLELGDVGNLAAEYAALEVLCRTAHPELAKQARERSRYYLDNLLFGGKPSGVVQINAKSDTAKPAPPGRLFKRA